MKSVEEIDKLIKEAEFKFDIYDFEDAKELILKALNKSREEGLENKIVNCLDYWGYFQVKELGDIQIARNSYEEAISILLKRKEIDFNRLSNFYNRLGLTYYRTNPKKLLEFINKAVDCKQRINESEINYSFLFRSLGHGYKGLKNYEASEENYLKCIELNRKKNPNHQNEFAWAHIIKELSIIYHESNQKEKAKAMEDRYEIALEEGFYKSKPWLRNKK